MPVQFDIAIGKIEKLVDLVGRETLDPEQMPVPEPGLRGAFVHEPGTIGGVIAPRNSPGFVNR